MILERPCPRAGPGLLKLKGQLLADGKRRFVRGYLSSAVSSGLIRAGPRREHVRPPNVILDLFTAWPTREKHPFAAPEVVISES
jgi:hypothetical protein